MIKIVCLIVVLGLAIACNSNQPNVKNIGIIALGDMKKELVDSISLALKNTYQLPVIFLGEKDIPERFFVNIKSPRYRADSIIRHLKLTKTDTITYVLGITAYDISTTKKDKQGNILKPESKYVDWGIFGFGYMPGEACVVSSFRLKHKNKSTYINRLQKVAIHEIGHNMGLPHCTNKNCVMTDAVEKISTIDNEGKSLCNKCQKNSSITLK